MKMSRQWLWLLVIPLIIAGLWQVQLKTKVLDLLPSDEPVVKGLNQYQEHFSTGRELMITLQTSKAEESEVLAKTIATHLRKRNDLVSRAWWQPPWKEYPIQTGEILAWLRMSEPPNEFGNLTNQLADQNLKVTLDATRETLSTSLSPTDLALASFDPFGLIRLLKLANLEGLSSGGGDEMFVSSNGCFRVIYVRATSSLEDYRSCTKWCESVICEINSILQKQSEWHDAVVHYTGRPMFEMEISRDMQRDIKGSIVGTSIIIALLFWIAHRRLMPMLWLLTLLFLILISTLSIGSILLGPINIISMGFAAILLGLAVDYALVHYQEALAHPHATIREIRRAIAPSIIWAATTTICAFLVLNFGGLPGLAQLGSLVAIGVFLSAIVMVLVYLPPLFRDRNGSISKTAIAELPAELPQNYKASAVNRSLILTATMLLLAVPILIVILKPPQIDRTANSLRPTHSPASEALREMQSQLHFNDEPLWIIVSGKTEEEVFQCLKTADAALEKARQQQTIANFILPTALWPVPQNWRSNTQTARIIAKRFSSLHTAARSEGFTEDSMQLTKEMLSSFDQFGAGTNLVWPTNQVSQWLLDNFVARDTNQWFVMGMVFPSTNTTAITTPKILSGLPPSDSILLTGWQLLGNRMIERVEQHMWKVLIPMGILVFGVLLFAFRSFVEIALGCCVLLMSGLCVLAVMAAMNWSWNLFNLMALPLILGTGVDYCIFIQLALRRHHGDMAIAHKSVGRALVLCGATAVAGFGSLAWSGNEGLSSFGRVCGMGILTNMLLSVYLLPAWWTILKGRPSQNS